MPDLQENGMALFLLEGHAVSALVYRWVAFMCSHSDAVQAAVVCCIGMMLTAFYHTLDAFVHIHDIDLLKNVLHYLLCPHAVNLSKKYLEEHGLNVKIWYNNTKHSNA